MLPLLPLPYFYLRDKIKYMKHNHSLPPGPWTIPIIGSLHHLVGSGLPHRALRDLSQRYGHIMFLKIGERPTIVISSRDDAKIIMKTHETAFCNRPDSPSMNIFTYGGKDLVTTPYGNYWREIRRIITSELLSNKLVQSFRPIREVEVSGLVKSISYLSAHAHSVDLSDMMSIMVNKVAVRSVTGSKRKEQILLMREMKRSGELATTFDLTSLFPSSRVASLISGALYKAEDCHRIIDQQLDNMIQEYRACDVDGEAHDLLGVILRLHDGEHTKKSISMDTVKAIIFDAVGGGTDTTGTILHWTMSKLVKNPRVMKMAQDEVRRLQGCEIITESDLTKLDFLHLVLKETLRLHPVAPLIPRVCQEAFNISNFDIPKGTTVVVNLWAIGRDPKYWQDPEEFKPERFTVEAKGKDEFEFFPFGAGRRICPGKAFGSAIVELTLANLLYHFNWELPYGMKPDELDMTEAFGVNVKRKLPLMLHAVPHKSC
ncbi:hypothetical protein LUZ63_016873 [Rhynchospora breviuscula]|uniref:Cytochrome P450 n=1 Tax=Rhynchospora breviuscula TaxID=2022672 RepID=A0A9P9ZBR8_9POAL|nr:hypothetical protein LUZ63_016873 [Rhynchospora breviuscula]